MGEATARGVSIRALYQRVEWEAPDSERFRRIMDAYHRVGVAGRITAELPMKMAVADRTVTLLAMMGPGGPNGGFPTRNVVTRTVGR